MPTLRSAARQTERQCRPEGRRYAKRSHYRKRGALRPMASGFAEDSVLSIVAICLDPESLNQLRNSLESLPVARLRSEFPRYVTDGDDSVLFEPSAIYIVDLDEDRDKAIRTVGRIRET